MSHQQISYLRLARGKNIGPSTFFHLLKLFGSAENAILELPDYLQKNSIRKKITILSKAEAEKELEDLEKFGAKILPFEDEKYPPLLREISDPPPVITFKGRIELLSSNIIALVGARSASLNGIYFTKKLAGDLGKNSVITASGMARGIDCAAHQASISTGTIAVIAGGINHIYPKENTKLYEEIIANGLLLAENPFNSTPERYSFIQRNRIISGLSLAVIVIEAGLKSGSLTTARFAMEQNREVFAVPGSPLDPRCHGTNRLIKEGAKLLENINDIFDELSNLKHQWPEKLNSCLEKKVSTITTESELKKIHDEICQKLNFSPISIHDLIEDLKITPSIINAALVELELLGKVTINFDKISLIRN